MALQVSFLTQSRLSQHLSYAPWSLAARHTVIDCLVVTAHLHSPTCLANSGLKHNQNDGGPPKSGYALIHNW